MLKIERKKLNMVVFIAVAMTAVVVGLLIFQQSGAWLTFKGEKYFAPQYSNYTVGSTMTFTDMPEPTDAGMAAPTDGDKLFVVDVVDDRAENYIGKMKINVNYQGKSMAYLRVKLIDEWTYFDRELKYRVVLSNTALLKYNMKSKNWVDNRKNDGYYYYKLPVGNKTAVDGDRLEIDDRSMEIEMLYGMESGMYTPDPEYAAQQLQMRMGIKVEAVQVNRIKAFWGKTAQSLVDDYRTAK